MPVQAELPPRDANESVGSPSETGVSVFLRQQIFKLAAWTAFIAVLFCRPLLDLVQFAWKSDLFSYTLLVPFITGYLIWNSRGRIAATLQVGTRATRGPDPVPGPHSATGFPSNSEPPPQVELATDAGVRLQPLAFLLAGLSALGLYYLALHSGRSFPPLDRLSVLTLSSLLFFYAGCFSFFGTKTLRAAAFPLAFLVFLVPFPIAAVKGLEWFLQHGSAEAAYLLLKMSGMPILRDGNVFNMPNFSVEVAPQCSGIHSTVVLFITSLLAGKLLLRSGWSRFLFTAAVIPLGLLRNGFRIWTLSELCVHVDPTIIDSALHHSGGPIFFALSLIPLFLLLLWLRHRERKRTRSATNLGR